MRSKSTLFNNWRPVEICASNKAELKVIDGADLEKN